jgi:hypothetical protein
MLTRPGELPADNSPSTLRTAPASSTPVDFTPSDSLTTDSRSDVGGAYPPREKMKVSDFARRLREAEGLHKEEEDARRAK